MHLAGLLWAGRVAEVLDVGVVWDVRNRAVLLKLEEQSTSDTKRIERTLGFMWTIEVLGRDPSDPYEEFEAVGLYADVDVEGVETELGTEE